MKLRLPHFSMLVLAGLVVGCGSSSDDVSGTWIGTDTRTGLAALTDTVTLQGNSNAISGTFVATLNGVATYSGTITGTFSKPTFQFTVTVPNGSVANEPNCSLGILGTGTYVKSGGAYTGASKTLSGSLTVTPTGDCSIGSTAMVDTFSWTQ
jgi:hypothetical protein